MFLFLEFYVLNCKCKLFIFIGAPLRYVVTIIIQQGAAFLYLSKPRAAS